MKNKLMTSLMFVVLSSPALARQDDITCMTKAIYFEAGGESTRGKVAVGHVILNRMNSKIYPQSICAVTYQKNHKAKGCQFTWSCKPYKVSNNKRWQASLAVAKEVVAGKTKDPTQGATSFNNRKFRNKNLQHVITIGNHYFYKNKIVLARSNYSERMLKGE